MTLTPHEEDQEFLYLMARAGRVTREAFAAAARELEKEAECWYLKWLICKQPKLVESKPQWTASETCTKS